MTDIQIDNSCKLAIYVRVGKGEDARTFAKGTQIENVTFSANVDDDGIARIGVSADGLSDAIDALRLIATLAGSGAMLLDEATHEAVPTPKKNKLEIVK